MSRPIRLPIVPTVSSHGAAVPWGGPLAALPRASWEARAIVQFSSTAATSPPATVPATSAAEVCHVAVSVKQEWDGSPGPSQAVPS